MFKFFIKFLVLHSSSYRLIQQSIERDRHPINSTIKTDKANGFLDVAKQFSDPINLLALLPSAGHWSEDDFAFGAFLRNHFPELQVRWRNDVEIHERRRFDFGFRRLLRHADASRSLHQIQGSSKMLANVGLPQHRLA